MKKYKGMKSIDDRNKILKNYGFTVDAKAWDAGSDWIYYLNGQIEDKKINKLAINYLGHFIIFENGKAVITHLSSELDDETWYLKIMDAIYE